MEAPQVQLALVDRASLTLSVYGLGYIGLPTSLEFANAGFNVVGVDVNQEAVDSLNRGEVHIFEEGLEAWYRDVRAKGLFRATTEPTPADVFFIAVPTPILQDKTADMRFVKSATEAIATVIQKGAMVVLVSTSPPRTCLDLIAPILRERTGLNHETDYDLVHCPERVIPGAILEEFKENDRIVGGTTPRATERAFELYSCIVGTDKLHKTDSVTAEMCKLMENTYRDVNIALANEIAKVCGRMGIDARRAIQLANLHPRVNYLSPGIGVGGHCIPIDPWFIIEKAPNITPVMQAARRVNDARPHEVVETILDEAAVGPIALLGLAFKPNVDDLRESPAVEIAELLAQHEDEDILVCEPYIRELPPTLAAYPNVRLVSLEEAVQASTVVALVAHREFQTAPLLGGRVTLDFVGVLPKEPVAVA
jgi:UDP-N-acetyl-D-mannosaminuronic acid dehydrogenase